jgi:hypothetical protein
MGYSRKKNKKVMRRTRKSFSKKNRKRGGCSCKKSRMRKPRKLYGGNCETEMLDINKPMYDRVTSLIPYRN